MVRGSSVLIGYLSRSLPHGLGLGFGFGDFSDDVDRAVVVGGAIPRFAANGNSGASLRNQYD